jgi:hypothetical protein
MIETNFSNFEWGVDIDEICKSMGLLGEGIYIQILEDLIGYINNDFTNGEIINLCVKIKIGIEVLKNNYRYIEEQRLTNKLSDNDLDSFSDIDLSDDKPEINAIVNFIKCIFKIIKNILQLKEKNICDNKYFNNHFGKLSNTLLKFLKFFGQNFLSKYLNNQLTYTINSLINDTDENNNNSINENSITPKGDEPNIVQINLRRVIFKQLIFFNLPELCSQLELLNILPENYFDEWCATIFSKNFNIDIVMKIWDLYVVLGEKIIFYAGVLFLKELEEDLLNCEEKEEALNILLNSQEREINEKNILNNILKVNYPEWIKEELIMINQGDNLNYKFK